MKAEFNGVRSDCRAAYPDIPGDVLDDIIMRTVGIMGVQAARAQGVTVTMTRIAENKLSQMGATIHGVLVKNEAGAWAAVSEFGRVMWLDGFEGQMSRPQPAQQGVPEGWRECLLEMVQAMHDYEMSVDEGAPYKHRAMMERAHALLSATPQPPVDQGEGR